MSAEVHPQVRALLEIALAGDDEPGPPDLEAERAAFLQTALELGGAVEEVARTEDVVIPDVEGGRMRARAYWPTVPAEPLGVLVWLHGGGWYVGDIESFDRVTRQLANASGAVCLSVEYRLAPEALASCRVTRSKDSTSPTYQPPPWSHTSTPSGSAGTVGQYARARSRPPSTFGMTTSSTRATSSIAPPSSSAVCR